MSNLLVQRKPGSASSGSAPTSSSDGLQDTLQDPMGSASKIASDATVGGGSGLPHLDTIQSSFGDHDVSGVRSFAGSTGANEALGSRGFAYGDAVGFKASSPDLHTAAHEAAHVVQQRGGVSLKGEMGQVGDRYEQHADAVADAVVAGQDASPLLDQVASSGAASAGGSVQRKVQLDKEEALPKKEVSSKAMGRLSSAGAAISYTKSILSFGAGNQEDAIRLSKANSYYRLKAMRDRKSWTLAPGLRALAAQFPNAMTAAKAQLAQGGNCGEHAAIAFDYLRRVAGCTVNYSQKSGLDHAFVILGDIGKDGDNELAVSDPWPTSPTATLWEDHFAYTADPSQIIVHSQTQPNERDVVQALLAGLKLTKRGQKILEMKKDDKGTDELVDQDWVWGHGDAAAEGKKFDYVEKDTAQE